MNLRRAIIVWSVLLLAVAPVCSGRWICSPYSVPRITTIQLQSTIEYSSLPIWSAVANAVVDLTTPHYAANQEVVRAIGKGQSPAPAPVYWTMKTEIVNDTGSLLTIDPSRSSVVYPNGEAHQLSALVESGFTTAIPPQSKGVYTFGLAGLSVVNGDIVRLYLEWTTGGTAASGQWSWIITEYVRPPSQFWHYFWLTLGGLWLLGVVVMLVTGNWPH